MPWNPPTPPPPPPSPSDVAHTIVDAVVLVVDAAFDATVQVENADGTTITMMNVTVTVCGEVWNHILNNFFAGKGAYEGWDADFFLHVLILAALASVDSKSARTIYAQMCDLVRDRNSRSGQSNSAEGEEQAQREGQLAQKVRRLRDEVIREIRRVPRGISPAAPGGLAQSELLGLLRVTAGQLPRLERKAPPTEEQVAAAAEHLRRLHVSVGRLALLLHRRGADIQAIAAVQRLQIQLQKTAPALAQAREAARRLKMQEVMSLTPGFKPPISGGFGTH